MSEKWDVDCDNGDYGILYDRHGDWIPFSIRANLYNGDVLCAVEETPEEEGGKPKIDHDKGEMVTELRRYAAPLKFIPAHELPDRWSHNLDPARKARPV